MLRPSSIFSGSYDRQKVLLKPKLCYAGVCNLYEYDNFGVWFCSYQCDFLTHFVNHMCIYEQLHADIYIVFLILSIVFPTPKYLTQYRRLTTVDRYSGHAGIVSVTSWIEVVPSWRSITASMKQQLKTKWMCSATSYTFCPVVAIWKLRR